MTKKEIIEKLKDYSDYEVFVYLGDDELISSINSSYMIDSNEFIVTDGAVITSINEATSNNQPCIIKKTAIRGGTYLIIGEYQKDRLTIDIRVDESKMTDEKINEIISKVKYFKEDDDVEYYIKDYNTNGVYQSSELPISTLL